MTCPRSDSAALSKVSSPISPLAQDVVSLIAAGEVIDSLAAAVRELAENAIDAGATRVSVALWPQQWRVQVADNGMGMDAANLAKAAIAHATSKIRSQADLSRVSSLGFRGEALHSLAQLGELAICSRPARGESGWRMTYDAEGRPAAQETVAIAPGTVVTASSLFARWPSRRAALPQQLCQVQQTLQHLALCHPQITWQVEQDGHGWFTLWPGTAKTLLPQLLRVSESDLREWDERFTAVNGDGTGELSLLLGLPDRCHRRRPDWVKVAVNGRMVHAPELFRALLQAFRRTLPRDRYPVCLLSLRVPPEQVDWNRTPAKSEIYLQGMEGWCDRAGAAVASALQFDPESVTESGRNQRAYQLVKAAEQSGSYQTESKPTDSALPTQLTAVAQVSKTYVLAEHSGGVCLIEQHIAHERVLYERLRASWHMSAVEPPIILNQLSPQQVEQLQRIGADIAPFGEQLWAVRSVPDPLAEREDREAALLELSQCGDLDAALVATACRAAIRNGTPLTLEQMQTLLDDWQRTQNPRTCPHGRPICLSLEESSLSRYFRRHWVIGKSHGI